MVAPLEENHSKKSVMTPAKFSGPVIDYFLPVLYMLFHELKRYSFQ